jgi:hypothetical protein
LQKRRTFLIAVDELDKDYVANGGAGIHDFVEVTYKGDLESLPKRYSLDQDVYGHYVGLPQKPTTPS